MQALLDQVISIARQAALEILAVYASEEVRARQKDDASPVTDADERAAAVIVNALDATHPRYPVVCEEALKHDAAPVPRGRFWLVDPLDGTREFIARNGEFTVNIALIEDCEPILGVVFAPALNRLFTGAKGLGAFLEDNGRWLPLGCRRAPAEGLTVVSSRSHGDAGALRAFLQGKPVARVVSAGSSLKFCMVAAGEADLYARLGRTMEWDAAAGGRVTAMDGAALKYGKPGLSNPHFVATGL